MHCGLIRQIWKGTDRAHTRGYVRTIFHWVFSYGAVPVMGTGAPGVAALRRMGVADERLGSLPFFAESDAYRNSSDVSQRRTSNPLRILSAGRIANKLKGHDIAVRALALVATRLGAQSLSIHCRYRPGRGHSETARARGRSWQEHFRLLGWVEPKKITESLPSG